MTNTTKARVTDSLATARAAIAAGEAVVYGPASRHGARNLRVAVEGYFPVTVDVLPAASVGLRPDSVQDWNLAVVVTPR